VNRTRWITSIAAALAGAVTVAIGASYSGDMQLAREPVARLAQTVQTPCGAIEYAVVGDGHPLLLVHGAGGGFDQGLRIAMDLAQRGLKIILPSRFGYLGTPLPADASPQAQADAHACLLDALRTDRAAIAGVSAGASSALQFALRHPERTRALLLIAPALPAPGAKTAPPATKLLFDTALRSDFLFWTAIRLAPDILIESILATPPALVHAASADEQRRVHAMLMQILPVSSRRLGLLNDARVIEALPRYPFERVAAPALVISAEDDGFGTWNAARAAATQLPNVRFVGYSQGGHVWVGHHDALLREVAGFVQETAANGARPSS
jgi:pimeloyl-ACP methyl ester carboxylesterase